MGYIIHHSIIVTTFDEKAIEEARIAASSLFPEGTVTAIQTSPVNACYTFFIGPDGSKEGWSESEEGDVARAKFIEWAIDHSELFLDWCEVAYGGDYNGATIAHHSDEDKAREAK